MSLVKPEDFAKALKISYGTIRSKISRGGLLRNKNKLIDTEHPTNYIYILEINGGDQSVFEEYHQGVISKSKVIKKSIEINKSLKNIDVDAKKVVSTKKSGVITEKQENENTSDSKASVNIAPTVETKIISEKKSS